MKTKTVKSRWITLPDGKKVKCMPLKEGQVRKYGDLYLDGTPINPQCIGQTDAVDTYRPIKPTTQPQAKRLQGRTRRNNNVHD